jgi:hypothetical protein
MNIFQCNSVSLLYKLYGFYDIIQLVDLMDIKYFTLIWLWYLFNKTEI